MGARDNGEKRKQHATRRLPLPISSPSNRSSRNSSSTRSNAIAMILSLETAAMSNCLPP